MKNSGILKLVFLFFCSAAAAKDLYLEARGAYFFPTSSRFRKNYSGSGIYGLEFDFQLSNGFFGWLETDYYYQSGHTGGDHNRTTVDILRYSLGLKYIYNTYFIKPYIGIGPAVSWLRTHVDSSFLIRSKSKWGVGPLIKMGSFFLIKQSFFIDLFIDYSWQTMEMHRKGGKNVILHQADISGFSFGGGLGYRF